ncbi:hypothetical protein FMM05_08755 [Flavobacterium zepuense]|uniref:Uncharacterized protein n=1 Tax=Flavobacterium zepuense TaxID=2593302 RepID=A0A552V4L2_9FLAO|nr:hypothetical protein [Flavobacterium zepuense]TRW25382.1 hypothetical protein FMM05_08755 [Flavobacterium zepuense]
MDIDVLVYDNQLGYYNLLNEEIINTFSFTLYDENKYNESYKYDVVVFFLSDEIELIDLLRLYEKSTPFIFASDKLKGTLLPIRENCYWVDLNYTRDVLLKELEAILKNIAKQINENEKAL